jgi:hypothetical protein
VPLCGADALAEGPGAQGRIGHTRYHQNTSRAGCCCGSAARGWRPDCGQGGASHSGNSLLLSCRGLAFQGREGVGGGGFVRSAAGGHSAAAWKGPGKGKHCQAFAPGASNAHVSFFAIFPGPANAHVCCGSFSRALAGDAEGRWWFCAVRGTGVDFCIVHLGCTRAQCMCVMM